jgi:hypothetical protein
MALVLNGSGSITGLSAGGLPDGSVTADDIASLPAGSVIQVVQGSMSSQVVGSGLSATWGTTGLSASITPSSTSNKVLVLIDTYANSEGANYNKVQVGIFRGSTELKASKVTHDTDGTCHNHYISYLDSPSTTSSTTYSMKVNDADGDGGTCYINKGSNTNRMDVYTSTITLMEIAA